MSRPTCRRELFGASAALLLLAAPEAGATKAAELNGRLLALCAECVKLEVVYRENCWATDEYDETHTPDERAQAAPLFKAVGDRQQAVMAEISTIPARTPEGLTAKARAILAFYDPEPPEAGDAAGAMLWSLVYDLAGAAAL